MGCIVIFSSSVSHFTVPPETFRVLVHTNTYRRQYSAHAKLRMPSSLLVSFSALWLIEGERERETEAILFLPSLKQRKRERNSVYREMLKNRINKSVCPFLFRLPNRQHYSCCHSNHNSCNKGADSCLLFFLRLSLKSILFFLLKSLLLCLLRLK